MYIYIYTIKTFKFYFLKYNESFYDIKTIYLIYHSLNLEE